MSVQQSTILITGVNENEQSHDLVSHAQLLAFSQRVLAEVQDADIRQVVQLSELQDFDLGDYSDAEDVGAMYAADVKAAEELVEAFKKNLSEHTFMQVLTKGNVFLAMTAPNGDSIGVFSVELKSPLTDNWRDAVEDHALLAVRVMNIVARRLIAQNFG